MPDYYSGEGKGKLCSISILSKNNRHASKKAIIHEFFHYKHYVESGYDWSKQTQEDREKEEKRTHSETQKYMQNLKVDKVK